MPATETTDDPILPDRDSMVEAIEGFAASNAALFEEYVKGWYEPERAAAILLSWNGPTVPEPVIVAACANCDATFPAITDNPLCPDCDPPHLDSVGPHIPGTDYYDGRDGSIERDEEEMTDDEYIEQMDRWRETVEWQRGLLEDRP